MTGNVHSGFTAEFTPREVGPHSISVEYNGHPVSGTPFIAKAYDAKRVYVGSLPQGHVGKPLQFTGELNVIHFFLNEILFYKIMCITIFVCFV